jgi:hypothetical protein
VGYNSHAIVSINNSYVHSFTIFSREWLRFMLHTCAREPLQRMIIHCEQEAWLKSGSMRYGMLERNRDVNLLVEEAC